MNEKQTHFVENEVSPLLASEGVMVLDDEFVRRDAHMECVCFAPALKINTKNYHSNNLEKQFMGATYNSVSSTT